MFQRLNRVSQANLIVFAIMACYGIAPVLAEEPAGTWRFALEQVAPFWESTTMHGESVLFIKDQPNEPPHASLLFVPTRIISVRNAAGDVTYKEGKDYVWDSANREIRLPEGSRIVSKTPKDLRRPAGSQRHRLTHRDGDGEILFGATHEYHDMQTVVTYAHAGDQWAGRTPSFAGDKLHRVLARLKARKPVTITLLGDSISTGCNASGWAKVAPYQPAFQDLLVLNLKSVYGGEITLKNLSVGGMDSAWGLKNIDKVIATKPNLVILAFGMNDAVGRPAEQFKENTDGMIQAVRAKLPETEFILIATMMGNTNWTYLKAELFPQFRDALASLCGDGIVLADMTSIWSELLKRKKYWDLTGNGVNHPNDFGHRIYAQVLSVLLVE